MNRLGLIYKVVRVKQKDGQWIPNPEIITDRYSDEMTGQIAYGEYKAGEEQKKAKALNKSIPTDFTLLDQELDGMIWTLATKFDGCLMTSVNAIRQKKKFFWDITKTYAPYWCGANMATEAYIGFNAFNTEKITGSRTADFIKLRQEVAKGHPYDDELLEMALYKPQK